MKRYKVTFNYFESGKKRIGIRILEALDKEHALQLMAMWPKLILKVVEENKLLKEKIFVYENYTIESP